MSVSSASAVVLKRLCFGILLLILVLPAAQARWSFVKVDPLGGYFELAAEPVFNWGDVRTSRYQDQVEHFLNDQLGFRPWLIRLRNQLIFSLFHQPHVGDTVLGEKNVLFQAGHIQSYLGQDFIGEAEVRFYARRFRLVQDDLAAQGTQLLYLLAPGKPRYQPEDLPATTRAMWPGTTNYAAFARELAAAHVQTLDAVALYQQWKKTAKHPLFPRGGTHWSGYGVTLVADTLFRRLEALGQYDLPDFRSMPGIVTTRDLRFTDDDIAKSLNLLWEPVPYPMAYPTITFDSPRGDQKKANVLLVGDSFAQSFYGFYPYLSNLLHDRSRFWYYNQQTFWPEVIPETEDREVHKLSLREQLKERDAVVLVSTEQNMNRCGFGFIDEVYHLYHPYNAADTVRMQQIREEIIHSPQWAEKVIRQAESEKISVDQAFTNEAYYVRERER